MAHEIDFGKLIDSYDPENETINPKYLNVIIPLEWETITDLNELFTMLENYELHDCIVRNERLYMLVRSDDGRDLRGYFIIVTMEGNGFSVFRCALRGNIFRSFAKYCDSIAFW